ncbi:hypothetical protein A6A03_07480 [Chloroflexus islandicus]|uniref:DUF2281 domain-containing protein n=1 Tax=Chloroflexus islandicus TaxID=1707952 RepID=A0A178MIV3_9CHLR|nr:hypothetical protein [Chloroflexus islandicus]OAN48606.1 hypothetical protein A6A03_07480 [Chloroflexus islandicus]
METTLTSHETRERIIALVQTLPAESLPIVEAFVRFVQAQQMASFTQPATPWRYPTVAAPAISLENWLNLLDEGYEGDALADTEAVFDEDYEQ